MKLLLLFVLTVAATTATDVYDPNAFVRSFNIWVSQVRSVQSPNTINSAEIRQWMEVKVEWEILKRRMDEHYAGRN